jgi:hypothetical protein
MSLRKSLLVGLLGLAVLGSAGFARAQGSDMPQTDDDIRLERQQEFDDTTQAEPVPTRAASLIDYYQGDEQPLSEGLGCSDACTASTTSSRFWANAEYLLWESEGMYVPALATTSTFGTPSAQAGVLGQPATAILKGQSRFNDDVRSGGRFELGWWLDPSQRDSLAATYFFVGQGYASFHVNPADNDIIARPFLNITTGLQDSRLIAYPNLVEGTVDIEAESAFHAAAIEYRRRAVESGRFKVDYIFGYMYAQLDESVFIRDSSLSLSGVTQGTQIDLYDEFDSNNAFHGVSLGLAAHEELGERWTGDVFAKASLGGVASSTTIAGETATTLNGVTTTNAGGLLSQGSNLGTHREGYVSSAWELGLKLRRRLTVHSSLVFGYSWFLLSDVERAGEQIDLGVNVTQIPPGNLVGAARPAFPGAKSTFWTQGLSFGLEARF